MKYIIMFFLFLVSSICAQQNQDSTSTEPYRPGDHELILMPTAYTMEKGSAYFEDYQIVLLNFTYAPANGTHLGVLTLFPITSDFLETITLGVKQNIYQSNKFAGAFFGSFTPKGGGLTLGGVTSIGKKSSSLHLSVGAIKDVESGSNFEFLFMAGYRGDISRKFSLIAEYTNLESGFENDFGGLLTLGMRFRGEDISWDLGAVRILEDTDSDLLFLPVVKAIFVF